MKARRGALDARVALAQGLEQGRVNAIERIASGRQPRDEVAGVTLQDRREGRVVARVRQLPVLAGHEELVSLRFEHDVAQDQAVRRQRALGRDGAAAGEDGTGARRGPGTA